MPTPTVISSHFGYVTFTATTVAVTLNNSKWSTPGAARLAEVTTSATTGTRYLGVIQDPSWSVEFPLDSAQLPETLGIARGQFFNSVFFARGSSGFGQKISETTVEAIEFVNDNTSDAVRVTISGKGGFETDGTTN